MVTQKGDNTFVVGIHGNFDDAQSGVKAMFGDKELAAELDKGVSLKLTLNLDRTITGFEISLTKDLLATICEMSAEIETDGTTSVKTGFRFSTGLKLSVSCGAEKAAHKADFNAEEFVKLFPSQPETDGGNTDGGNTDTTAYAA